MDAEGARETIRECFKRLRSNPNELKDKVAAFGELLAVAHLVPDVSDAVPLLEFVAVLRVYLINPTRSLRMLALRGAQLFIKTPR